MYCANDLELPEQPGATWLCWYRGVVFLGYVLANVSIESWGLTEL